MSPRLVCSSSSFPLSLQHPALLGTPLSRLIGVSPMRQKVGEAGKANQLSTIRSYIRIEAFIPFVTVRMLTNDVFAEENYIIKSNFQRNFFHFKRQSKGKGSPD